MTTMRIPSWLKERPVANNDHIGLKKLLGEEADCKFKNIKFDELKEFYTNNSRENFYRLIRMLGFYGVVFTGKLASYSGPNEAFPEILQVDKSVNDLKIVNTLEVDSFGKFFISSEIHELGQLNGVPIKSIHNLVGNEVGLLINKLPIKIVRATDNFYFDHRLKDDSDPLKIEDYRKHYPHYPLEKSNESELIDSVESLYLSVRSRNCLEFAGVKTITNLSRMSDNELLSIPCFGRKCLREIREKLAALPFNREYSEESNNQVETIKIDVNSHEILAKLKTRISDLVLSVRSRRCLKKNNIKYVWQLTQLSEKELRKFRNLGRKSIDELCDIVRDHGLSLGMDFTAEQLSKVEKYVVPKESLSAYECLIRVLQKLSVHPLSFLNERENLIVFRRLFKEGKKDTLETIGQDLVVSRERIRQIEKSSIKKIRQQYIKEFRIIRGNIKQQVDSFGGLANLEDLEIGLNGLSVQEQNIVVCLLSIMDENISVDWDCSLITSKGEEWIATICNEIKANICTTSSEKFFTEQDVVRAVNSAIGLLGLSGFNGCDNLIKRFKTDRNVNNLDNCLCFGRVTKQDKIAQIFRDFFPQGLDVYKKQDILLPCLKESNPKEFENTSPRAVLARLTDHPDILLWGRGFFIHEDHVSFDELLIDKTILWIERRFDKGHSRFQVDVPFNYFRRELQTGGVPNPYALYTLIRLQNVKRIGQRKYPTIVDLDADVDILEGILVELESYFLDGQGPIPYSQIQEEFLVKRGWKVYSLNQNINTHSELIFPWQANSYIHLEYMDVNFAKLDELIDSLRAKLKVINTAYSLKGAKKSMGVLWEEACPSASVRTMIKLIRSVAPEDLQISGHFIQFTDHSSEFISVAAELEEFFLDKGVELNSYELREEFCVIRGWSEIRLYGALRKARLFRSGKSTYLHPTTIGWNESLSQEVHRLLEDHLAERNINHYPHMQIGELIDEYVLPELPQDIQWTRQLLKSVGEELGDFLFFDDAYLFQDNSFDIEDMDDMVAYLIARYFKLGIAKKSMVEELLWREGILESGHSLPSNLFFEESSIQLREESNEVELSPVGISRYAKQS
jgi:DNA-directed RNA polymerase specialized sigma subunit